MSTVLETPAPAPLAELAADHLPVVRPDAPVARIAVAAAASTLAFVALSVVSPDTGGVATVQYSTGLPLLLTELFWLSAAAMGASFATFLAAGWALKRGHGAGHESSYWVGLCLGVMAGFILVLLTPAGVDARLTIAMLGAFLASAVFCALPGARTQPG